MRRSHLALSVLLAGATFWSSCILSREGALEGPASGGSSADGGAPGVGGFGGSMTCIEDGDCGADTDCATVACVEGSCKPTFAAPGTPCSGTLPEQTLCDGQGSCVECASGEDCLAGDCANGTQTGGETCVDGQCETVGQPVECGAYVCNAQGTSCLSSCDSMGDCSAGHYCEPVTSTCETPNATGALCTVAEGCQSGFCVDGVCCDSACDGDCLGCSNALTTAADGTCSPIPFGDTDPDTMCSFGFGCGGDGTCIECGEPTVAPVGGACPSGVCNGGCSGDVCTIDCTDASSCEDATINCPAGWDCQVNCQDGNSCKNATLNCPPGRSCNLSCNNQSKSCENIIVNCDADGPCTMVCQQMNGDHCNGAVINCGNNLCDVDCISGGKPDVLGGASSCMLTTMDC